MPLTDAWNHDVDGFDGFDNKQEPEYRACHRCYGTGEDEDGADCLACDGFGDYLV